MKEKRGREEEVNKGRQRSAPPESADLLGHLGWTNRRPTVHAPPLCVPQAIPTGCYFVVISGLYEWRRPVLRWRGNGLNRLSGAPANQSISESRTMRRMRYSKTLPILVASTVLITVDN